MREKVIELGGKRFCIREPPVAVLPYLQLYRKLVGTEPEDLGEARKRSGELGELVKEIISSCVEGPTDGLSLEEQVILLNAIGELISEALRPYKLSVLRKERGG